MAYTFEQIFAADPANPANVAANAAVTIFAPGDATMTPLTITDPDGTPLPNPIPVNANGFGSAFAHATLDRVAWAGGGFTGFFTSYEGMKGEAVAARAAAETAAANAAAEAQAAIGTATDAATTAATNAASSATAAANAAALVGAPADTAIATAINGSATATKAALNATFVPKWKANTAYASGDKVVSPNGDVVIAKAAFTSGASYDASKWDLSTSLIPRIIHYDVFDRADGAPGTAPTGQTYMTHQSTTNGLGKIVGGEFVSTRIDGVTNAVSSYIGYNFKETPVKFVQRFTQLGSATGVSTATIVFGGRADGADSTINEIIDRSVHLSCNATGITVQFRDKATYPDGVYPAITGSSYGRLPNTTAGQEFEWSVTRIAPDVLEIVDPNGKLNTVQHPDIERLAGRAVYWQCVEQNATGGNETRLQGIWTYGGPMGQTLPPLKAATKRPLDVAAAGALTAGQIAHLATNGISSEIDALNRSSTITALNATSGMLNLTYFTPQQDMSVSRCEFSCGATWATGITLFQYGLFSAASDGAVTLLAQTDPANTSGFSFADHIAEKPFVASGNLAASVQLKAGTRYAVGIMIIATTPGTVKGLAVDKTIAKYRNPMVNGQLGGQTAMPASLTAAQVAASSNMFWARLKV